MNIHSTAIICRKCRVHVNVISACFSAKKIKLSLDRTEPVRVWTSRRPLHKIYTIIKRTQKICWPSLEIPFISYAFNSIWQSCLIVYQSLQSNLFFQTSFVWQQINGEYLFFSSNLHIPNKIIDELCEFSCWLFFSFVNHDHLGYLHADSSLMYSIDYC